MKTTPEEKERKEYIRCIEKLIRTSLEYQDWSKDEKEVVNSCAVCKRAKDGVLDFETHHSPETLFEVVDHYLDKDFKTKPTLQYALELTAQHLEGKVPVKVICKCCHFTFHSLNRIK